MSMMTLISSDIAAYGIKYYFILPTRLPFPRFHFLTDSNFKPSCYIFVFYTRDVQPLFRKGTEPSWARSRVARVVNDK